MTVIRFLAIGLLSAVVAIPFLGSPRGDGFEHARLDALISLVLVQVVTVPIGVLIGIVLTFIRPWWRRPGYVIGTVTTAFGVLVTTQGWATSTWADGGPSGIGDPDGESVLGFIGACSGMFTIAIGMIILVVRWVPELTQSPPARTRNAPARP
ncbi:hypothetical protein [Nonomuraea sp. NPDC049480]|uniref:hypothetical protein n=1 Tax=Nonomuraea sp. NPDC049480 TaxID=3364353 RepID=UPI0037BA3BE2